VNFKRGSGSKSSIGSTTFQLDSLMGLNSHAVESSRNVSRKWMGAR
jgi:hypothetical protein